MSESWKLNTKDLRSALRHTVVPILAGAGLAGWQVIEKAVQSGQWVVEWPQVVVAVKISALAGVGRLLHRWMTDLGSGQ